MIAGLVLAAGRGARFGESPKLLADLGGRPLLDHAIEAQCAVPALARVVVVLGAHAEQLLAHVDLRRAEAVICEDWAAGLSASLQTGVAALAGADRVVVTLGDQPLITPQTIIRLLREPPGTRAAYHGRPGHPVLLGPDQLGAIPTIRGDRGAGALLRSSATVECAHLGTDRDIDTPTELAAIRGRLAPARTLSHAASRQVA